MGADENETTRLQGEAKERRGEATDDEELRDEGRADQVRAQTKDTGDIAGDGTKDPAEEAAEGVRTGIDPALDRSGE